MDFQKLKTTLKDIITSKQAKEVILQNVCNTLKENVPHYDWVGFYFKNGDKEELKLAEFAGTPTEHTTIPYGKGICGQVALSNKTFVVQDVTKEDNYISCGWKVKSEIVSPIFLDNKNIGQIDVDSHQISPFTEKDEEILAFLCKEIVVIL